ncbi:glutamate--tRNA ligase [Scenedesmus sp. PABB004]|nr:glutamate--tRNA ligase [Scenedesmus sp. PABB004]
MPATIVLPGAVRGAVVTRFPPEPSWLLDVGHCKAALVNEALAAQFEVGGARGAGDRSTPRAPLAQLVRSAPRMPSPARRQGAWLLRYDDTNPRACSAACVAAYEQDLPLLRLCPSGRSFASDFFGAMAADAGRLIACGFLYADDTPLDQMRAQRLAMQASTARGRPAAESLAAWREMQAGAGGWVLRMALDPGSENGALRDPVAFRVITDARHFRTGARRAARRVAARAAPASQAGGAPRTRRRRRRGLARCEFAAYPTYDFAAPWLDSAQGVTHALRTLEFRDRDDLYAAVQAALLPLHPGWRATQIFEFPRIHMAHTPQAKAHQRALLGAGLVAGPDDPRLPTLRGLMRGGCHPDALRAFLLEQARRRQRGSAARMRAGLGWPRAAAPAHARASPPAQVTPARKETYHSWDKLWTLNRRLLDPVASRHMAVADGGHVLLALAGGPAEPEAAEVPWKQGHVARVVRWREVWLDGDDAQDLDVGDEVTLLAWGNAVITAVTREQQQQEQQQQQQQTQEQQEQVQLCGGGGGGSGGGGSGGGGSGGGRVVRLAAALRPGGDPKTSKAKLHWLPALPELLVPLRLVSFSPCLTEERAVDETDVVAAFDRASRREARAWGDPSLLRSAVRGAVVQLQRKGLFIVDAVTLAGDSASGGGGATRAGLLAPAGAGAAPAAAGGPPPVPTGGELLHRPDGGAPAGMVAAASAAAALAPRDVAELTCIAIPDGHTKRGPWVGSRQRASEAGAACDGAL